MGENGEKMVFYFFYHDDKLRFVCFNDRHEPYVLIWSKGGKRSVSGSDNLSLMDTLCCIVTRISYMDLIYLVRVKADYTVVVLVCSVMDAVARVRASPSGGACGL
jgi:hypothetical protein